MRYFTREVVNIHEHIEALKYKFYSQKILISKLNYWVVCALFHFPFIHLDKLRDHGSMFHSMCQSIAAKKLFGHVCAAFWIGISFERLIFNHNSYAIDGATRPSPPIFISQRSVQKIFWRESPKNFHLRVIFLIKVSVLKVSWG